ncbi:hypothetical protein GCM10018954_086860 [Kutzneria kofuensis]
MTVGAGVPVGGEDLAEGGAAASGVHAVDEQHAVEVVGLVLEAAGQLAGADDLQRVAVHGVALGDDVETALGVEVEAGMDRQPSGPSCLLLVGEAQGGIDEVATGVAHVEDEDPAADAQLGSGKAGAALGLEGVVQILDELVQLAVEVGDGAAAG